MLQRTPGMAGLSKYWDSELTHTVVRSLTRVWQPDQSSVSLLSWYAVLLWVTETSTASLIPNDGWCTEMLPLCLFYSIVFYTLSPLVLLFSKSLTFIFVLIMLKLISDVKIEFNNKFQHHSFLNALSSFSLLSLFTVPCSSVFWLFPVTGECNQTRGLKQC